MGLLVGCQHRVLTISILTVNGQASTANLELPTLNC
jgi:hypothetical protein